MFDDATVDYFDEKGLIEFSRLVRARVKRHSPDVTSDSIHLPADCHQLLGISWRGIPLEPITGQQSQDLITVSTGRPWGYIFNKVINAREVRLYPSPTTAELLIAGNIDTEVSTSCILTYWMLCSNPHERLPQWFEQRLLRLYIQAKAYACEGKYQKADAEEYFDFRWKTEAKKLINLISRLCIEPRQKVVGPGYVRTSRRFRVPEVIVP